MKTYHIVTKVYEVIQGPNGQSEESEVASFGGEAQGDNFKDALPMIGAKINEQYLRVQQHADLVDADTTPDTPG
jgi:hypothetical protein